MAAQNYDICLKHVLVFEGGYSNDAGDPGGPTNFGITIYDYRKYVKTNATAADVRNMSLAEAKTIYRKRYWDAMRCDELPPGVEMSVFDEGVNSGIGRAGKVLRRLVDLPITTSIITEEVIAAVKKRSPVDLIRAMNAERLSFLRSLKTWPIFGNGWGRRVTEVQAFSLQLAAGAPPEAPSGPAPGKGHIRKPKVVAPTAGGAAGTATVGALSFRDWIAAHPIETALFAAGVLVVIGGVIYLIHKAHESAQTAPMLGTKPVPVLPGVKP